MKFSSRKIETVVGSGLVLLVARAAMPSILTWLANLGVQKVPGYRGRIRRVSIDFSAPRLVAEGLSLAQSNGGGAKHFLTVGSIVVGSNWRDLITGSRVAYVRVNTPRLFVDLDQGAVRAANRNVGNPDNENHGRRDTKANDPLSWQNKVKRLPAFRISSAILSDGEAHLQGISGQDGADLRIDHVNLRLDNLTNSIKLAPSLMATARCAARVMANGNLVLRAQGYPLSRVPTFDLDFQTCNVDLTEVRGLIENHLQLDVNRGIADLFIEAAAADGYIEGYAKPIFDHLELEAPRHCSFVETMKAWGAEALVKLGKNRPKDRIATRLDFEGPLDDPDLNYIDAVLGFFRNSFLTAERALLEHRIGFSRAGRTAAEVEIRTGNEARSGTAVVFGLLRETFSRWSEDAAPRMAAALSYYTVFSMAPLLILAIATVGLVLGRDAAQGKIVEQIGGLVGTQSEAAIQSMIEAANRPAKGIFAGVVGIISLMAGAIGVLSELKSALNKIWRTEERGDVKEIVKKNVVFVGMLLGVGFLLTVSLILSAGIAAVGKSLSGLLPAPELLLHAADFALSLGIIALMFAAIYRFLPNTKIEWRDVWVGAFVTSLLFNVGKLALGLYIGKGAVGSTYGAAGSVLVLLLWVYYSGLIFYFGAEFTKAYADRLGSRKTERRAKAKPGRIPSHRKSSTA